MKKFKTIAVAILIIIGLYLGFYAILSLAYPGIDYGSWGSLAAFVFLFLGNLLYWKWLKLLKKFKWNPTTEKWDQVFEEHKEL